MPLDVLETLEVDIIDEVKLDEALEAMLTSSFGFSTNYFKDTAKSYSHFCGSGYQL